MVGRGGGYGGIGPGVDQLKVIEYCASDPDGSAKVTLEVTDQTDGTGLQTVAEDLPAIAEGKFDWSTASVAERDWLMRATVRDARGMESVAWGRYFVRVLHETKPGDGDRDGDGADEEPANETGDGECGAECEDGRGGEAGKHGEGGKGSGAEQVPADDGADGGGAGESWCTVSRTGRFSLVLRR